MKDIVKSQAADEYKVINGKKVRLTRRRRRSNVMTYSALAVAVFTAIGLVACLCFLFDLKEVKVTGVTLYTNDQILAVGGVESGANLIRTNTSVIEKRLTDTLPYIKSAAVDKDYPNSLNITIVEEVKCAEIEKDGRYYVIAESGKILEAANPEHNAKLPLVKGFSLKDPETNKKIVSEDDHKAKVLLNLLDSIRNSGFEKITAIDITERTDILLDYDGRIQIKLGSSIDLDYKLASLKAVIDQKLSDTYEGTLKYNGANSGISAIPKGALNRPVTTPAQTTTTPAAQDGQTEQPVTDENGQPVETQPETPAEQPLIDEVKPETQPAEQPAEQPAGQPAGEEYTGWQQEEPQPAEQPAAQEYNGWQQ
ncbi:MAG: FtsQ-type POTRA domain-containing protein [Ruminococcus sp.]|nr:FtsQ-type POTRA domain-containing protein [Ruminococcus sp.]